MAYGFRYLQNIYVYIIDIIYIYMYYGLPIRGLCEILILM